MAQRCHDMRQSRRTALQLAAEPRMGALREAKAGQRQTLDAGCSVAGEFSNYVGVVVHSKLLQQTTHVFSVCRASLSAAAAAAAGSTHIATDEA